MFVIFSITRTTYSGRHADDLLIIFGLPTHSVLAHAKLIPLVRYLGDYLDRTPYDQSSIPKKKDIEKLNLFYLFSI